MIRKMLASVSTLLVLSATAVAYADTPAETPAGEPKPDPSKAGAVNGDTTNHFGEKGTIALDVTTGPMIYGLSGSGTPTFGIETRKVKPEGGDEKSNTYFYVNPRLHYFIVHNVSIGGEVLVASAPAGNSDGKATAFGLMPKVGFDVMFGDTVSFFPQAGLGFRHVGADDYSETWWFADVDLPLLVHPAKHLAIGLGPQFTFTLSQNLKVGDAEAKQTTTSYRWLTAHVIGWF